MDSCFKVRCTFSLVIALFLTIFLSLRYWLGFISLKSVKGYIIQFHQNYGLAYCVNS